MSNPLISIVTPAPNDEGALERLISDITAAVSGTSHEIVIVDDGSRDATWQRIQQLQASNHHIRGARLTRNFGHQRAIRARLTPARGDAVIRQI